MNRKERRLAQSQNKHKPAVLFRGRSYTVEEAVSLAVQEHSRHHVREALEIYDGILAQMPGYTDIHNIRGVALHQLGRHAEALASCDKAIALSAGNAGAYSNRGAILCALQNYPQALASLDKAIALNPAQHEAHFYRGLTLWNLNRFDEALVNYDHAIALQPDYFEALLNRATVLAILKRFSESLAGCDKVIAMKPDYVDAYTLRGNNLRDLERHDEALASYDKAIALDPGCAGAHYGRGNLLHVMQRLDEALVSFRHAAALKSYIQGLADALMNMQIHLSDWKDLDAAFGRLAGEVDAGHPVISIFGLVATPLTPEQQQKAAVVYTQTNYPPSATPLWNGERYTHDKIRIGYFSADFHNHATSFLMAELIERHDRSRFEVTGFSFGPQKMDAMRNRLEKAFDRFIDVSAMSDLEIATLARQMEIDIAVDLKGFTKDARTGIFALRPAPVQVSYLGYPSTMGASYIDYLIADPILIPEDHRRYYTEKIAYLPDCYQVNDASRKISEKLYTRQEMGLPDTGFVFCCFNDNYKIKPDIYDIWMRLLHKVPGSVLWLLEGKPAAVKNLRMEAVARGIAQERLVFAKRTGLEEHLARHRLAGLFLDTFHCNAHTTASDALWADLPVLTCLGETFANRVAASLLHAVGMPELVAHSPAEYEALALELATHPEKLSALRLKLGQNRLTHPLFNTRLFTRHIEEAYMGMYKRYQAGLLPEHILR